MNVVKRDFLETVRNGTKGWNLEGGICKPEGAEDFRAMYILLVLSCHWISRFNNLDIKYQECFFVLANPLYQLISGVHEQEVRNNVSLHCNTVTINPNICKIFC